MFAVYGRAQKYLLKLKEYPWQIFYLCNNWSIVYFIFYLQRALS